jgi:hypothetical protein
MDIKRSSFTVLISAAVILLTILRFCPVTTIGSGIISGPEPYVYRVPYLLEQIKDPLALLKAQSNDNNSNALRWRILFPLLANIVDLSSSVFVQLPRVGSGMFLAACTILLYRLTKDWTKTFFGSLLVATSSAFLVGTEWISLDPFFLILVLIFVFAESPLAAVGSAIAAPWADERFVFFLIPLLLLRHSYHPVHKRVGISILCGTALYLGIRLFATSRGESSVALQLSYQSRLDYPVIIGWYFAFGVGWLLVLWGIGTVAKNLWSAERRSLAIVYSASLAGALVSLAFLAGDTTRSIAVCVPFLVKGVTLVPRQVLYIIAPLNFVLPTACYVYSDGRYLLSCFSW